MTISFTKECSTLQKSEENIALNIKFSLFVFFSLLGLIFTNGTHSRWDLRVDAGMMGSDVDLLLLDILLFPHMAGISLQPRNTGLSSSPH